MPGAWRRSPGPWAGPSGPGWRRGPWPPLDLSQQSGVSQALLSGTGRRGAQALVRGRPWPLGGGRWSWWTGPPSPCVCVCGGRTWRGRTPRRPAALRSHRRRRQRSRVASSPPPWPGLDLSWQPPLAPNKTQHRKDFNPKRP